MSYGTDLTPLQMAKVLKTICTSTQAKETITKNFGNTVCKNGTIDIKTLAKALVESETSKDLFIKGKITETGEQTLFKNLKEIGFPNIEVGKVKNKLFVSLTENFDGFTQEIIKKIK